MSYGQSRVQVVWNRVILPDTSSFQIDKLVGTDLAGYAGLEDGVDWHWDRVFGGAALTTLLGIGAELAAPENRNSSDRVFIAGRDSLKDSVNQVGQEMTRRDMNMQPTLTERPGLPVRVIVNRDLTFVCPVSLKADLDHYAALHAKTYGESVDAVTLIPHMLEALMAGDRGFKKRDASKSASQKLPQREATPP